MHLWEAILLLLFSLTGWVCACWALWQRDGAVAEMRRVAGAFGRQMAEWEALERFNEKKLEGWRAHVDARVAADLGAAVESLAQFAIPTASHVDVAFSGDETVMAGLYTLLPELPALERATFAFDSIRCGLVVHGDPASEKAVRRSFMARALAERLSRVYAGRLAAQLAAMDGDL